MKRLYWLAVWLLCVTFVQAQPTVVDTNRFAFHPDLTYNTNIPSPKDFLGYELGDAFTVYAKVEHYFKTLAEKSDRVVISNT